MNISELNIRELEDKFVKWASLLADAELKIAKTDAEYYALKVFDKVILNKVMPNDGKVTEKEKVAYANPEYLAHLEGLKEAYRANAEAHAEHARAKVWYETLKSILLKRM